MTTGILIAGGVVLLLVLIVLFIYVPDWDTTSESTKAAQSALETVALGRDADLVAEPPSVHKTPEVNTHRDGDPIVVPIIEVTLDTDDEPDRATGYRIAAGVLEAVHPEYTDTHVRNYDIHLVQDEDTWVRQPDKCRIAVTPALVERLTREPDFDAQDLQREVEAADDGDDEIPPVAWGEPLDYWHNDGSSAAAVTTTGVQ
ncbi:hypothetical protein [Natranaeroarchaeum sulfidigenes]|uniref:Uncharacterized protein n=1 Tax=Natranaeroarchaeum sulfidigenes TaxID=2784880 RepID=A0A897MNG0_9EURY|nr:hypothetical protein [Natranaeroarchaeum sulfidigenes]QSG02087.1 Uncharacterized protein AArcS_0864 [Natranaeroarchaeum sulfidigenes]